MPTSPLSSTLFPEGDNRCSGWSQSPWLPPRVLANNSPPSGDQPSGTFLPPPVTRVCSRPSSSDTAMMSVACGRHLSAIDSERPAVRCEADARTPFVLADPLHLSRLHVQHQREATTARSPAKRLTICWYCAMAAFGLPSIVSALRAASSMTCADWPWPATQRRAQRRDGEPERDGPRVLHRCLLRKQRYAWSVSWMSAERSAVCTIFMRRSGSPDRGC